MFQDLRRARILDVLQENGVCYVTDLCKQFSVSEPTIRNDLMVLEQEGKLTRQHGGAFLSTTQKSISLELEPRGHEEEKKIIGEKAASLVHDGDSLIIDSGSTTTAFARYLKERKDLTIVTNAINIALLMGKEPSNHVLLIGGVLKSPTLSLTGDKGLGILDGIHVEQMFLATGGITIQEGLTYPSDSDIKIKMKMIQASREVILLADSSKVGQVRFSSLGGVDLIDTLVTDSKIKDEQVKALQGKGIRILLAK